MILLSLIFFALSRLGFDFLSHLLSHTLSFFFISFSFFFPLLFFHASPLAI